MSTILGSHNIDVFSLSNPELATFGNQSNEARIRMYDYFTPNGAGGYLIGMSNARFSIIKETGPTLVGIGTNAPTPGVTMQVQGTMMTSNIATYNPDSNIYFNGQSISGMSNINFTGTIFQNGSVFKTSQWLTTASADVLFPGNVAIGAGSVSSFGSACNLLVVGNMLVTGYITASNYINQNAILGVYSSASIYTPAGDGSKTILTNDPVTSNCVLFSFNLNPGRYIITSTIPYQNLTPMVAIDSANWANIGLYQCTPATLTTTTPQVRFTQMTAIGSYLSTDLESVTFTWFLDSSLTNSSPYVIAVLGKGHQLKFAPAGFNFPAPIVYTVPMRGIGYDDVISVRQALQINPIRFSQKLTGAQQSFPVAGAGYLTAASSNVDFYVNGAKLNWANTPTPDFGISATTFDGTNTTFVVTTNTNVAVNSLVDILVWPQVNPVNSSFYSSGFLYQQINTSTTPWMNVAGGGVRLGQKCVIDGDLYVKGSIWGGCNTSSFISGVQYTGTAPLNIAANSIGTTNIADGAVTASKLYLTGGSVTLGAIGIGTTAVNTSLYTMENFGAAHFAGNVVCDNMLTAPYVGKTGTPLSILGCANPIILNGSLFDEINTPSTANKITFQAPWAMNITTAKLPKFTLTTGPSSGSSYTFDITVNGTSIYQTRPNIVFGSTNTALGGSSSGVLKVSPTVLSENDVIVASVSIISGTGGGIGPKVYIYST